MFFISWFYTNTVYCCSSSNSSLALECAHDGLFWFSQGIRDQQCRRHVHCCILLFTARLSISCISDDGSCICACVYYVWLLCVSKQCLVCYIRCMFISIQLFKLLFLCSKGKASVWVFPAFVNFAFSINDVRALVKYNIGVMWFLLFFLFVSFGTLDMQCKTTHVKYVKLYIYVCSWMKPHSNNSGAFANTIRHRQLFVYIL